MSTAPCIPHVIRGDVRTNVGVFIGPPVSFISAEYRQTRAALESGALLEARYTRIINGAGNELIIINNI